MGIKDAAKLIAILGTAGKIERQNVERQDECASFGLVYLPLPIGASASQRDYATSNQMSARFEFRI